MPNSNHSLSQRAFWKSEYLIFLVFLRLFKCFSARNCYRAGAILGFGFYCILPKYRRLVLKNLRMAFGHEQPLSTLRRWTFLNFYRTFAYFLYMIRIQLDSPTKTSRLFDITELKSLPDSSLSLMVSGHVFGWELFSVIPYFFPNRHLASGYRRLKNPLINDFLMRKRNPIGGKMIARDEGLVSINDFLKDPAHTMMLFIDQSTGQRGVVCPFFGNLNPCSPMIEILSRGNPKRISFLTLQHTARKKWKFHTSTYPYNKVKTSLVMQTLEKQMRQQPTAIFWLHNYWKVNPQLPFFFEQKRIDFTSVVPTRPFNVLLLTDPETPLSPIGEELWRAWHQARPDLQVSALVPENLTYEFPNSPSLAIQQTYQWPNVPQNITSIIQRLDETQDSPCRAIIVLSTRSNLIKAAKQACPEALLLGFSTPKNHHLLSSSIALEKEFITVAEIDRLLTQLGARRQYQQR